jgi:hypothetical protein
VVAAREPAQPAALDGPGESNRKDNAQPRPAMLVVESSHALAPVELFNESGGRISPEVVLPSRANPGRTLVYDGLDPGFYRARVVLPEGNVGEKLINLESGPEQVVSLSAPLLPQSRLTQQMIQAAELSVQPASHLLVDPSTKDIVATPHASTLLCVSSQSASPREPGRPVGNRLRAFGLGWSAFTDASGSIQVLIAADFTDPKQAKDYVANVELRIWPLDQPAGPREELKLSANLDGLGGLEIPRDLEGPHWVSFKPRQGPPVVFAVTPVKDHMLALVFNAQTRGGLEVYEFINPKQSSARQQRQVLRLELIERYYLTGRLDAARELAYDQVREQLRMDRLDPVSAALAAFLFSHSTSREFRPLFGALAGRLMDQFSSLSDSHVIMAESLAGSDPGSLDAQRRAYERALRAGLPLFGPWIDRLKAGVMRFEIAHERAPLLDLVARQRILSFPWTAWSPRSVEPGRTLLETGVATPPNPFR